MSKSMIDRVELIEKLAAIEHERWSDWQRYMHSLCTQNADNSLTIPAALVERWNRQINTPYADLSNAEQASDREQVMRYLHFIEKPNVALSVHIERLQRLVQSQHDFIAIMNDQLQRETVPIRIEAYERYREIALRRVAEYESELAFYA